MEQCTFPFCLSDAYHAMIRYYEKGGSIESNLCTEHKKLLIRMLSKKGIRFTVGPITYGEV